MPRSKRAADGIWLWHVMAMCFHVFSSLALELRSLREEWERYEDDLKMYANFSSCRCCMKSRIVKKMYEAVGKAFELVQTCSNFVLQIVST